MSEWRDEGFVMAVRPQGEHAALVQVFCREQGVIRGLVQGGMGRRLAAHLQPGNQIDLRGRTRAEGPLGQFQIEPLRARTMILSDRGALSALGAALGLLAVFLPENQPTPAFWQVCVRFLDGLAQGGDWRVLYPLWEAQLLADVGFGLDLAACAVTGAQDGLAYVSPKTGRAVSAAGAGDWAARLLPLPAGFARGALAPEEALIALRLTGHFLERALSVTGHTVLPEARARLIAWATRSRPQA